MKHSDTVPGRPRVFIAGAGGLGSPVAMILAQRGIPHIGIADDDTVELSNLQRQIIHTTSRLGRLKTDSAAETIARINPETTVEQYPHRISIDTVPDMIKNYDLVINALDNFPTRYLLNDACYFQRIPVVDGGVLQFDGQVTTFLPGTGPCLRCIFPVPPPEGVIPTCREGGVLGPLAGLIGSIQAWESLNILQGQGPVLVGKLWIISALTMQARIIKWPKNPHCPLCGESPTITRLEETHYSCGS